MVTPSQFVIFQSLALSYCFEETIGFGGKASFARRPVFHLNKPVDITKKKLRKGYSVPRDFS